MQEEEDYDAVDEDDRYGFLPSSVVCTPEWGECKVTQLLLLCVELYVAPIEMVVISLRKMLPYHVLATDWERVLLCPATTLVAIKTRMNCTGVRAN